LRQTYIRKIGTQGNQCVLSQNNHLPTLEKETVVDVHSEVVVQTGIVFVVFVLRNYSSLRCKGRLTDLYIGDALNLYLLVWCE